MDVEVDRRCASKAAKAICRLTWDGCVRCRGHVVVVCWLVMFSADQGCG
jgi:hypothetical protein